MEHSLVTEKLLTLSLSEGWPILAGLGLARVGLALSHTSCIEIVGLFLEINP